MSTAPQRVCGFAALRQIEAECIGTDRPGKSSLLLRFTDDDFLSEEETAATIGVDFKVKSVEVDGRRYKLSIWVSLAVIRAWNASDNLRTLLARSGSGRSRQATTVGPRVSS